MQFGLPLNWPVAEREDSFIVSDSNRGAVAFLNGWGRWPVATAILTGPRKSGRSLLGRIFAAKSGGTVVDDAMLRPETEVFHLWNAAQDLRRPLLIIADVPPPSWRVTLPDLASRLTATPSIALDDPDLPLVEALFDKLLKQRGLGTPPEVLRYLAARIERSHVSIIRTVDALDDTALSQNRAMTVPLAKQVLLAMGIMSDAQENS